MQSRMLKAGVGTQKGGCRCIRAIKSNQKGGLGGVSGCRGPLRVFAGGIDGSKTVSLLVEMGLRMPPACDAGDCDCDGVNEHHWMLVSVDEGRGHGV